MCVCVFSNSWTNLHGEIFSKTKRDEWMPCIQQHIYVYTVSYLGDVSLYTLLHINFCKYTYRTRTIYSIGIVCIAQHILFTHL